MVFEIILAACAFLSALLVFIVVKVGRGQLGNLLYYEITFLLGSGGHTGEMCELVRGLRFNKADKINMLIGSTDRSSQNFFRNSLKKQLGQEQYDKVDAKITVYYVSRTNEVKQSYATAAISATKALVNAFRLILSHLGATTHFVSNGPGTCVPFIYIFFLLKKLKVLRVKLIFIESWCRVQDISLSGKLVRPIVDQFIVHWPQLAAKYKNVKYHGQII